ncbi:MAG: hypothetical protein ACRDVD_05575, partial [Acidimicrobiia bacterium]
SGDAQARLSALEQRLLEEETEAECELGSVVDYLDLAESRSERRASERLAGALRPGDVIDVPGGPREGRYAVLKRLAQNRGTRLLVLGTSGRVSTIGARDVIDGTRQSGRIELPSPFRPRDRAFKQNALRSLRKVPHPPRSRAAADPAIEPSSPVALCPDLDKHLHWLRRARRTRRRIDQLRQSLRSQGVGLVAQFDAIRAILEQWNYLQGWELTPRGTRLRFIYNELDLLLTEATERGLLWELDAAELAAFASTFVYEPRREESGTPAWPTAELATRWEVLASLWEELVDLEQHHRLPLSRKPDHGVVMVVYQWASGVEFEDLGDRVMAPGDFVRVTRQLVDLIRQIREAAPEIADVATQALRQIDRGVVAAQGLG